jgi:hypothetical protein
VPIIGLPNLIDVTTPQSAYQRTGFDGETYNLVFSDEVGSLRRMSENGADEMIR